MGSIGGVHLVPLEYRSIYFARIKEGCAVVRYCVVVVVFVICVGMVYV